MELLQLIFVTMDKKATAFLLFILVSVIALTVSHAVLVKKKKDLLVWRILCVVPLAAGVLHLAFCHLRGGWGYTLLFYGTMYATVLVVALWQFFAKRKYGYRVMAVFVHLVNAVSILVVVSIGGMFPSVHNFTAMEYTEAFEAFLETMQEEYVLSEWKETDYEALEAEILPMVEEAEREQDPAAYDIALMTCCYRFYDGHVQYNIQDPQCEEEVRERLAGNDYGFSMITLDNGDTVAVLAETDSDAGRAGIHNGTVITKWGGVPIEEAKGEIECIYPDILSFPVAENEAYMQPVFLAGTGEAEQEVAFLDEDGQERTVLLHSLGSYRERLENAISAFYHFDIPEENFSTKMLTEDCGYLRIASEEFTLLSPEMSATGELTPLASMLEEALEDMKAEGMTSLIIDLRNNTGGSDETGPVVASMFAKEEYFSHAIGRYEDGAYIPVSEKTVPANGKFSDVEVVVLVNAQCCSAGDAIAEDLSALPNVTLMGITTSNGVDQGMGGWCFMPECGILIAFPNSMVLDEKDEPRIDTGADRVTRIPLDCRIPLTLEAAEEIFGGGGDYELEYALDYLEQGH